MADVVVGTDSPNYTPVVGDVGANLYCKVTATNSVGSANANSNTVGPVEAAPAVGGSGWNPSDMSAGLTLSNADKTVSVTTSGVYVSLRGAQSRSAGKLYFEITIDSFDPIAPDDNRLLLGLADGAHVLTDGIAGQVNSLGVIYHLKGTYLDCLSGAGFVSGVPTCGTGDTVGIAADLDTNDIWYSKNGVWVRGDPATATLGLNWGATAAAAMFPYHFALKPDGFTNQTTINTGPTFAATPPTGFSAWG